MMQKTRHSGSFFDRITGIGALMRGFTVAHDPVGDLLVIERREVADHILRCIHLVDAGTKRG